MIPLKLFANRVFSAANAIGFVVGFAMFGAISFLRSTPGGRGRHELLDDEEAPSTAPPPATVPAPSA